MKATLFDHNGSDRHIAAYFWTSTDKDQDAFTCPEQEVVRIIGFGMRNRHATPFGHPHVTFLLEDIPLFVVHQILRHRSAASVSEKSHRYVDAKPAFYEPAHSDIRTQAGRPGAYEFQRLPGSSIAAEIITESYDASWKAYSDLVKRGVASELARAVLPSGLLTRLYVTFSLRNWLNYLVLRNDEHTQLEHRRVAEQIEDELARLFPITVSAWGECGRQQL